MEPGWVAGASIGAVTAAIIAGNPRGRRSAALGRFWDSLAAFDGPAAFLPAPLRQPLQYVQVLSNRTLGHPPMFTLRPPDLAGTDPRPGLFDPAPMRRLLAELIDLGRLNDGSMRVSVLAVDLASGQEVAFDTSRSRISLDHVMASAALVPDFPPVEVEGRLLVDGGLSANLPIHLVMEEMSEASRDERMACFAVDLFPPAAPLPRGLLQAAQRQSDLTYASQTLRSLRHLQQLWQGWDPGADLFTLVYQAEQDETALKGFDFSASSLARRNAFGRRDMQMQIKNWRTRGNTGPGLAIHPSRHDTTTS